MAQFRFRTRKILWLGSYEVTLPYNKFSTTWSFAVSLPYKSFDFKYRSSTSAQRISSDLKFRSFASAQGIYYVSKFSSSAFANRQSVTWSSSVSHNILWLEFPQFPFRKKRCHLKFSTSRGKSNSHYCIYSWNYHIDIVGLYKKKKNVFLLPLFKHFGCYGNLKVSIDLQLEKWKLNFIAISLQIFWQKFYGNVCWVVLHQTYHFSPNLSRWLL